MIEFNSEEECLAAVRAAYGTTPEEVKVLYLLPQITHYGGEGCDKVGVAIDTETTGVGDDDEVIELVMTPFFFNSSGRIGKVLAPIRMLNEPTREISEKITKITGLTRADVAGHRIDPSVVSGVLSRAKVVVAHNAKFDRKHLSRYVDENAVWLCSRSDVDWDEIGISSTKLDYLAYCFGFYYEAHRATDDVAALIHLIAQVHPARDHTVLAEMFSRGLRPQVVVEAYGSPFETKDALRERGYRWDAEKKVWQTTISADDLAAEQDWLTEVVYGNTSQKPAVRQVPVTERFRT